MALLGFLAVIGLWLWSARGMVGGLGNLIGFKTLSSMAVSKFAPTPTTVSVDPINAVRPAAAGAVIVNVIVPTMQPPALQATYTPYPTFTPFPTQTGQDQFIMVYPAGSESPGDINGEKVKVKVSHYWPPLGGINCDHTTGDCLHMADGNQYIDYVGRTVACPSDWPLGSKLLIAGGWYQCRDRGGAIVMAPDGAFWVDILYPYNPVGYWGIEVEAILNKP